MKSNLSFATHSQDKNRGDNEDEDDHDVLPHIHEIRKILFVGFLQLIHAAKIGFAKQKQRSD